MRIRGYTWLLAVLAASMLALPVSAQVKDESAPGEAELPETLANCDLAGYKSGAQTLTPPTAIPDFAAGAPGTVTVGPIIIPADGSLILDVILEVQAAHTWVGDLTFELIYDLDCLAATPNISMTPLCRPRGSNPIPNAPCGAGVAAGCSSNLISANVYRWTDGIGTPMNEGAACATTANIASGCFRPSTGGGTFAVFSGLPKGGCWYLRATDYVGADVGTITSWKVHILNSATATQASSWGTVKTLYR